MPVEHFTRQLVAMLLVASCSSQPAARPAHTPLVTRVLSADGYDWKSLHHGPFAVHSSLPDVAADSLGALARAVGRAASQVQSRLEADTVPAVHVFFVASPEQLLELAGGPGGGRTDVEGGAIFYVLAPGGRPPLRHELAHYISWRAWGAPHAYWISEGLAVWGAGTCEGKDLHEWAAALLAERRLVSFSTLAEAFDFSSAAAHLQGGSFVQFVSEYWGSQGVRALWRGGMEGLTREVGIGEERLTQNWQAVLKKTPVSGQTRNRTGRVRCE